MVDQVRQLWTPTILPASSVGVSVPSISHHLIGLSVTQFIDAALGGPPYGRGHALSGARPALTCASVPLHGMKLSLLGVRGSVSTGASASDVAADCRFRWCGGNRFRATGTRRARGAAIDTCGRRDSFLRLRGGGGRVHDGDWAAVRELRGVLDRGRRPLLSTPAIVAEERTVLRKVPSLERPFPPTAEPLV